MKINQNDPRINLSRIQVETRQVASYHRADRVINNKIVSGSSVTSDFGYRCEVYTNPHLHPGPKFFEAPESYRKWRPIIFLKF